MRFKWMEVKMENLKVGCNVTAFVVVLESNTSFQLNPNPSTSPLPT